MRKKLQLSEGLRKILHNAGWMMGEQVLRMATALFVNAWVARRLGPSDFGLLSYVQSLAALFVVVALLGMSRLLVRELVEQSNDPQKRSTIVLTAFSYRMLAAILLFGASVAISGWGHDTERFVLAAFVSTSILAAPFDSVYQYFQSLSQARIPVIVRSVSFFAATGVKLFLLYHGAGLQEIVYATALEYAFTAIGLYYVYRKYGMQVRARPNWRLGWTFVRETWPEIIAGLSGMLFMRLDQIMLESLQGTAAVGVFAVAARLSEAWYFIPVSLVASAFPKIVKSRTDTKLYYTQISRLMVALVALSYASGLGASLLSGPVVSWLYGPSYTESASILCVHIWCGLLVGFGQLSGAWLSAERRIVLNLYRNLLGLVVNVPLNYFLIPRFGPIGAAWATLISMTFGWYLFDMFNPLTRRMFIIKSRALLLQKTVPAG